MHVLPEKSEHLCLSAQEKSFTRALGRIFSADEDVYYVLHINPLRKNESNPLLFNMLLTKEGIILFYFNSSDKIEEVSQIIRGFNDYKIFGTTLNNIKLRLQESRYLTDNNKKLKYALSIKMVFPCISLESLILNMSKDQIAFCKLNCIFKEDIRDIKVEGKEKIRAMISKIEEINSEDRINNIFQRLCPEITIARKFLLDEYSQIAIGNSVISEMDRGVQSYRLDSEQINFVNNIEKGNQLILACAGSGKSVLLICKCFKLASLNPSSKFLITCYNKNLCEYYRWAIAQAGFTDRNVLTSTFYSLCSNLLKTNQLLVPTGNYDEEHYQNIFMAANEALSKGLIKDRFVGIFIDEVQIFKPEWYRFCYNLLKSKNDDSHYFCIAGDKSQDIKNNIRKGKAPWQGGGSDYPEYRGKTKPIERNYRNSKEINDFIDGYILEAKNKAKDFLIDISSDPELFLRGISSRAGNKPKIVELVNDSVEIEAERIVKEIRDLIQIKGYSEVDIAVILYNNKQTYSRWDFKTWLEDKFRREGWESPAILFGDGNRSSYGARTGISITTIDGSLGLDFRAVVLAGLKPLGSYDKSRSSHGLLAMEEVEDRKEAYKKNVNYLYTGMTRARDELLIILSSEEGESIYQDLIRKALRRMK